MIRIYQYDETYGAKIALKHKLYVPRWSFYKWFSNPLSNVLYICIAWDEDNPIGCAVISADEEAGIFVKEEYRSRGIGRRLLKYMTGSNVKFTLSYQCQEVFYCNH